MRMIPARPFWRLLPLLAACSLPLAAEGPDAVALSGSVQNRSGYIALGEGSPDAAAVDWYSTTSLAARLSADGETSRFFLSLRGDYDSPENAWSASLDEAWFEWRPSGVFSLRAGRSVVAYGPCLAFNPANALSAKDSFDAHAGKIGFDGLFAGVDPFAASGEALPFALAVNAACILPGGRTPLSTASGGSSSGPYDLGESGVLCRISFLAPGAGILGPTEVGASGDFRRLGGTAPEGQVPSALGAWLSADVAGSVIGAEGTMRTAGFSVLSVPGSSDPLAGDGGREWGWAASLNRKAGDFFVVLEASQSSGADGWTGFLQIARARGDAGQTLSALVDLSTLALRSSFDAYWNVGDRIVFRAEASWNRLPEKWRPALPADWTAGCALECFL